MSVSPHKVELQIGPTSVHCMPCFKITDDFSSFCQVLSTWRCTSWWELTVSSKYLFISLCMTQIFLNRPISKSSQNSLLANVHQTHTEFILNSTKKKRDKTWSWFFYSQKLRQLFPNERRKASNKAQLFIYTVLYLSLKHVISILRSSYAV